jgi:hypothetical protein
MPQPPEASVDEVRSWDRPLMMLPLFVLIAAIGGLFGSFTLEANLLVLAVGGTLIWLSLSGRAVRHPSPNRLTRHAAWWLVPMLVVALTELFAFFGKPREEYPTISLLADPVLDHYLLRAVAYFGWVTGFWALVRR